MITKRDAQAISEILKDILEDSSKRTTENIRRELHHGIQDLREEIVEKISSLPTKKEFYDKMDAVVTELQEMRDDHTALSGRVEDHDERLETLETNLKIPQK